MVKKKEFSIPIALIIFKRKDTVLQIVKRLKEVGAKKNLFDF